jgi:NAD(P)H dehydrogenase (quinone)
MLRVVILYHSINGFIEMVMTNIKNGIDSTNNNIEVTMMDIQCLSLDQLYNADTIVFGCPTIMGGPSAQFKSFMDLTTGIWHNQIWKNKLAAGFTTSEGLGGDKLATLQAISLFAAQHSMIWISQGHIAENEGNGSNLHINRLESYIGCMAQNHTDVQENNESYYKTAYYFGKRIASATVRWN